MKESSIDFFTGVYICFQLDVLPLTNEGSRGSKSKSTYKRMTEETQISY